MSANNLTGTVLVEYSPAEISEPVQRLIERALAFGLMSPGEYQSLTPRTTSGSNAMRALISAELGCLLFKLTFAGMVCPGVGAAAGVAFTMAALYRSRRRTGVDARVASSRRRIEVDQAS